MVFIQKLGQIKDKLKSVSEKQQTVNMRTKKMLKTPTFYGLWLCYIIGTLISLMVIGITSSVAEEIVNINSSLFD